MEINSTSRDFGNLIGDLYDAASNRQSWIGFLNHACSYFAAFGAHLIHLDQDNPELSLSYAVGFESFSLEAQRAAMSKQMALEKIDPRFKHARTFPNMPFRCTDIMPIEEFQATRVYQELLQPNGIEYSLMVQYSDNPDNFTGLAFFRKPGDPCYTRSEVDGLGEIIPHLRRTLALQRRLFRLNHQLDASYQVLEELPSGIAIVDEFGRIEFANAVARQIFDLRDGIEMHDGYLRLRRNALAELLGIIRQTILSGSHGAITLARPSGKPDIQCIAARLAMGTGDTPANLIARPRVALHLSDPAIALETPEQLLQRIFGLTQAEARVLERLVTGRTPEQAAADHGVGVTTVRTQIKSIFSKTNTSRQPELIERVLASPIWMARKAPAGVISLLKS